MPCICPGDGTLAVPHPSDGTLTVPHLSDHTLSYANRMNHGLRAPASRASPQRIMHCLPAVGGAEAEEVPSNCCNFCAPGFAGSATECVTARRPTLLCLPDAGGGGPTAQESGRERNVEDWNDHAFLGFRADLIEIESLRDLAIVEHLHEQVIFLRTLPISQRSDRSTLTD